MKHIPSIAISQRHPKGLFCKTDCLYASVADFINASLEGKIGGLLGAGSLRRVAISCALFLEDHFSRTHQVEVFMQWHRQKFGTLLPMYDFTDPTTLFSKEFQLVLWLTICAERGGSIINPENEGLELVSLRILTAVATFCNAFANGLPYTVNDPSVELELLYIDDLVAEMIGTLKGREHRCEFNGLEVIPAKDARTRVSRVMSKAVIATAQ